MNFFKLFSGRDRTVADCIAGFDKVLNRLEEVITASASAYDAANLKIDEAMAEKEAADIEFGKARTIKANITKLLEG